MTQTTFLQHHLLSVSLATALSLAPLQLSHAADGATAIPNYAEQVQQLEKKLYTGENALKVEKPDLDVMNQAASQLAADMPQPGLKVGEKAPDFALKDPYGKTIRLSDQLKKGPVVLVFYRGAWCPYCNLQLHTLKDTLPEITRYGATLVAVTPQMPDKSLGQIEKDGFPFEILSDLDDRVVKSYNLYWEVSDKLDNAYKHSFGLDITAFNGPGRRGLPVPGTFIIDRDGTIRAAYADTDYKKRMEPADILAALKPLAKKR